MDGNLIFDLGLHRGLDSEFYARKGFRVVGLEANDKLAEGAGARLAEFTRDGRLTIVQKALWEREGETVSFYVNDDKDDWSSLNKNWAQKGGHTARELKVETTTLHALIRDHGLPYYVKCDVEGADATFVDQLLTLDEKPHFVSVEAVTAEFLGKLLACGYDRFQLVNQGRNGWTKPPSPAREGEFADVKFNGLMSGLFGHELDPGRWIDFTEACRRFLRFRDLRALDDTLTHGWLDFHATKQSTLAARAE